MKKLLTLLLPAILLITSCQFEKSYKYAFGQDQPVEIKAKSDSAAFVTAYEMFCNSLKSSGILKQTLEDYNAPPKRFFLYNSKGEDITFTANVPERESLENTIEERVFSQVSSPIDKRNILENLAAFKILAKIDQPKIDSLVPYFTVHKDEFDPKRPVSYRPKAAPYHTNSNHIYCYFHVKKGIPGAIRFRAQYHDDTWLFFTTVQFSINGDAFELVPGYTERRLGSDGRIWEWFDMELKEKQKELIFALASSHTAKVKFAGRHYSAVHNIPQAQIDDIRRTLELYYAMGGSY
jgi:hypothetical protein